MIFSIFALEIPYTMKKTIFILVAIVAASLMGNAQTTKTEAKVKNLTYNEFLRKVWDFERNPTAYKYKGNVPAVVDFYADWCGPCRRVSPILEKLAEDYDGKLVVYKVNVQNEQDLAAAFEVKNIPTVFFFPTEGQPSKLIGAMGEDAYVKKIEEALKVEKNGGIRNAKISEAETLDVKDNIKR